MTRSYCNGTDDRWKIIHERPKAESPRKLYLTNANVSRSIIRILHHHPKNLHGLQHTKVTRNRLGFLYFEHEWICITIQFIMLIVLRQMDTIVRARESDRTQTQQFLNIWHIRKLLHTSGIPTHPQTICIFQPSGQAAHQIGNVYICCACASMKCINRKGLHEWWCAWEFCAYAIGAYNPFVIYKMLL